MKNTYELPRFVTIPGADLSTKPHFEAYSNYLHLAKEFFDPKTKHALLEPVFQRAAEVVGPYGVSVPTALHERMMFFPRGYFQAWFKEEKIVGKTMKLEGVAVLDAQSISDEAYRLGNLNYIDLLRNYSAHELVHLLSQTEFWMSTWESDIPSASPRRLGLTTFRPIDKRDYLGQQRLDEGVTDYLAEQIWPFEFPQNSRGYQGELEVVRHIEQDMGIEPLVQAVLTKPGLRILNTAMNETYGNGSLEELYAAVERDFLFKKVVTPEGGDGRSDYEGTHKFLRKRKI